MSWSRHHQASPIQLELTLCETLRLDLTLDDFIWTDLMDSTTPEPHPEITQDRRIWNRLVNTFWSVFI